MPIEEFERREKAVAGIRESHMSINGTMRQISAFMLRESGGSNAGASDLLCRKLPSTVRGHLDCEKYKGWC